MRTKSHIRNQAICFSELPRTYAGLIGLFPLRPIRDDVDAANVTEIVDSMAGHRLNSDQEDYLDVLSTLLADYEDKRFPVKLRQTGPLGILKGLLSDHDMSASDLGRLLGNRALGSKILRGERELSLANIRALMHHFAVDASLFI
jgi:antitoxin component HigA of HigAB toxin-antitoxin module